jgi:hypothetical protein
MRTIVLITRENSERVTHVSVYLCGNYSEARHFCNFVNHHPLTGEDKLYARMIIANAEHPLEKYQPFGFDDFVNVEDRTMQLLICELDHETLSFALTDAKEKTKNMFLRNMSHRAARGLEYDMGYMECVPESDIENARRLILDIYNGMPSKENRFDKVWTGYKSLKKSKPNNQADPDERDHIVLVLRGAGTVADCVSVYLFDEYDSADNFCNYINDLKTDNGSFFYARHAELMVEYETIKPILPSFDRIFEYSRLYGENTGDFIIKEALKKFNPNTILAALKGIDKHSRMFILQCLPTKTADAVNKSIKESDKYDTYFFRFNDTRHAQQRILNAVNKAADKFKKDKESLEYAVCKA